MQRKRIYLHNLDFLTNQTLSAMNTLNLKIIDLTSNRPTVYNIGDVASTIIKINPKATKSPTKQKTNKTKQNKKWNKHPNDKKKDSKPIPQRCIPLHHSVFKFPSTRACIHMRTNPDSSLCSPSPWPREKLFLIIHLEGGRYFMHSVWKSSARGAIIYHGNLASLIFRAGLRAQLLVDRASFLHLVCPASYGLDWTVNPGSGPLWLGAVSARFSRVKLV